MNTKRLLIAMICFLPAASAMAGRCDDREAKNRNDGKNEQRNGRPNSGRWWDISDEERQAALQFFQDHSPRRWTAYNTLPDDQKKKVFGAMLGRYKMMQFLSKDTPIHGNKLRQIEMEDEVFGMRLDLQSANQVGADELRGAIRQRVQQLVELRLEERALRIGWLEKNLQQEKDKLERDRQRKEELVESALKEELERKPTVNPDDARRPAPSDN